MSRFQHNKGLGAVLVLMGKTGTLSDLAAAVIYHHWTITFLLPCALGAPSPYEKRAFIE